MKSMNSSRPLTTPPPAPTPDDATAQGRESHRWRVGCVSYLNAKPLMHGLEKQPDLHIRYDVPSRLLDLLLKDEVDVALCPVFDYLSHPDTFTIVPSGGICSAGQTFTVRLYSRQPLEKIDTIHVDTDSHTSVVLMQVLLRERFNVRPTLVPFDVHRQLRAHRPLLDAPAMLLIGDKVVTSGPSEIDYPFQLDLGHAWNTLTGLPFVFATWLARVGRPLGDLPQTLSQTEQANRSRRHEIASLYAPGHHWPEDLARRYLTQLLHYTIGDAEFKAIGTFADLAWRHGLLAHPPQPLRIYDRP